MNLYSLRICGQVKIEAVDDTVVDCSMDIPVVLSLAVPKTLFDHFKRWFYLVCFLVSWGSTVLFHRVYSRTAYVNL